MRLHLTNYQNRYFGGAAMIRLYHFDLDGNVIDVETVSPWILGRAVKGLNELERQEIELSGDADRFPVEIDFTERFSGFDPVPARPARPASKMLIPGTVAYWRFESPVSGTVRDLSGRGNDLYVEGCPVVRNPRSAAVGITSVGLPWLLGGYEYAGKIDQILHGRLGDVRIVERALPVTSFMNH